MSRATFPVVLLVAAGLAQQVVWHKTIPGVYTHEVQVAVDTRCNVVVTAMGWVRKYRPGGESLWAKPVYMRLGVNIKVAVDAEDNIIVASAPSDTTWLLMKLSPEGESLWEWRGVWPDTVCSLGDIATSPDGSVLVTGSHYADHFIWVTFKLTASGQTEWKRTFSSEWGPDAAVGVCADPLENVVVGGPEACMADPVSRSLNSSSTLGAATPWSR